MLDPASCWLVYFAPVSFDLGCPCWYRSCADRVLKGKVIRRSMRYNLEHFLQSEEKKKRKRMKNKSRR